MNPQPHFVAVDDVDAAEREVARREGALNEQVSRAKAMRKEVHDALARAKQAAEDPALASALSKIDVPSVSVKTYLDEARLARLKAIDVRQGCVDTAQADVEIYLKALDAVLERVKVEEQGAKARAVQRAAAEAQKAQAAAEAVETSRRQRAQAAKVTRAEDDGAITQPEMPALKVEAPPKSPAHAAHAAHAEQRRATPRSRLCTEISVHSDSNFFTGFTGDVSEGGVFVATVNLLPIGSQIDVSFILPGGQQIEGKGEVRWIREMDPLSPDTFPGMGVRFSALEPAQVAAIRTFTAHREPMFFPES